MLNTHTQRRSLACNHTVYRLVIKQLRCTQQVFLLTVEFNLSHVLCNVVRFSLFIRCSITFSLIHVFRKTIQSISNKMLTTLCLYCFSHAGAGDIFLLSSCFPLSPDTCTNDFFSFRNSTFFTSTGIL